MEYGSAGHERIKRLALMKKIPGVPPRTRTLTNGFGDRHAAITSGIQCWWRIRESNS